MIGTQHALLQPQSAQVELLRFRIVALFYKEDRQVIEGRSDVRMLWTVRQFPQPEGPQVELLCLGRLALFPAHLRQRVQAERHVRMLPTHSELVQFQSELPEAQRLSISSAHLKILRHFGSERGQGKQVIVGSRVRGHVRGNAPLASKEQTSSSEERQETRCSGLRRPVSSIALVLPVSCYLAALPGPDDAAKGSVLLAGVRARSRSRPPRAGDPTPTDRDRWLPEVVRKMQRPDERVLPGWHRAAKAHSTAEDRGPPGGTWPPR